MKCQFMSKMFQILVYILLATEPTTQTFDFLISDADDDTASELSPNFQDAMTRSNLAFPIAEIDTEADWPLHNNHPLARELEILDELNFNPFLGVVTQPIFHVERSRLRFPNAQISFERGSENPDHHARDANNPSKAPDELASSNKSTDFVGRSPSINRQRLYPSYRGEKIRERLNLINAIIEAERNGENPISEHLLPNRGRTPVMQELTPASDDHLGSMPQVFQLGFLDMGPNGGALNEETHSPVIHFNGVSNPAGFQTINPFPTEGSDAFLPLVNLDPTRMNWNTLGPEIMNLDDGNWPSQMQMMRTKRDASSPENEDSAHVFQERTVGGRGFSSSFPVQSSQGQFVVPQQSRPVQPIFLPQSGFSGFQNQFISPQSSGFLPFFRQGFDLEDLDEMSGDDEQWFEHHPQFVEQNEQFLLSQSSPEMVMGLDEPTWDSDRDDSAELGAAEPHRHLYNHALIIQHSKLAPIFSQGLHPVYPQTGLHVSQNQQFVAPSNVYGTNQNQFPVIPQSPVSVPTSLNGGSSQISNIQGNLNTVNQNQQTTNFGNTLFNRGQITQIRGDGNAVNQAQAQVAAHPSTVRPPQFHSSLDGLRNTGPVQKPREDKPTQNKFEQSEAPQPPENNVESPFLLDVPHNFDHRYYRHLQPVNPPRVISKRSLAELIHDPNKQLDFPKTIQNIGTVAKHSFHDENEPMYHVNNFVGSIKDVFMSAMKVPPQDIVVPSQYKIVKTAENCIDKDVLQSKSEHVRSISPSLLEGRGSFGADEDAVEETDNDPFKVVETFSKVGAALRDSIQSGQNTLEHVGDIAHTARKVIQTAKHNAPRVLTPGPGVFAERKKPDSVTLIAPKVLEVKDDRRPTNGVLQAQNREKFVRIGDIMDALGVSNPADDKPEMAKIIVQQVKGEKGAPKVTITTQRKEPKRLQSKQSTNKYPVMSPNVGNLQRKGMSKAAPQNSGDLKHFVDKMKNEFNDLVKSRVEQRSGRPSSSEKVGAVLAKTKDQIGRVKSAQGKIADALKSIKDDASGEDNIVEVTKIELATPKNFPKNGEVKKRIKNESAESDSWEERVNSFLTDLFQGRIPEENGEVSDDVGDEENVLQATPFGISKGLEKNGLGLTPELLKPFMGRPTESERQQFLKENGNSVEEGLVGVSQDFEEADNDIEQEQIKEASKILTAVNPLMFEKMYYETMKSANTSTPNELFSRMASENKEKCTDPKVGNSMKITRQLLKPFMGIKHGESILIQPPSYNEEIPDVSSEFE